MTNEQRAAWLEGRRTGIGGSDVARAESMENAAGRLER